jgi:hypothetical protein
MPERARTVRAPDPVWVGSSSSNSSSSSSKERQAGRRHLLNIVPSPVPLGDTNTGATTCLRPAIVRRTPAARAQRHGHLAATPAVQLWKGAAAAEERVEGNERSRDSNRTKRRAIIAA